MPNPDLDRLLVSNLPDLEAAARHVKTVVQPEIARVLNERMNAALKQNSWLGEADYAADDSFWMAPPEWRKPGEDDDSYPECWFSMDCNDGNWTETEFWLLQFISAGPRLNGMRWSREVNDKRLWRKQLIAQPDLVARLRSRGFEFQEKTSSFFMPVRIDKDRLADAVAQESPELAFEPFDAVVQACVDAKSDFQALLDAIPMDGGRSG